MKVKSITYRRTKNLGNYENEVFEMTAELDESDSVLNTAFQLQEYVFYLLGLDFNTGKRKNTVRNNEDTTDF